MITENQMERVIDTIFDWGDFLDHFHDEENEALTPDGIDWSKVSKKDRDAICDMVEAFNDIFKAPAPLK